MFISMNLMASHYARSIKHDLDPRERTFNSYHIAFSDTTKSFTTSKVGGGKNVEVSQNIPFEYIRPSFNMIILLGHQVYHPNIKTITGTSISGSEASFT